MIGDIITEDGTVYEVVWAGGDGLLPDRETKPNEFWTPPKRLYNKKSPYWTRNTVDKPVPQVDNLTGDDNED